MARDIKIHLHDRKNIANQVHFIGDHVQRHSEFHFSNFLYRYRMGQQ